MNPSGWFLVCLCIASCVAFDVGYHFGTGLDTAAHVLSHDPRCTDVWVEFHPNFRDYQVDESIAVYSGCWPGLQFVPQCKHKTVMMEAPFIVPGARGLDFHYDIGQSIPVRVRVDSVHVTRRATNWTAPAPCPIEPLWTSSHYGGAANLQRCHEGGKFCVDGFGSGWENDAVALDARTGRWDPVPASFAWYKDERSHC